MADAEESQVGDVPAMDDAADHEIARPEHMDRKLYETLRRDYNKARSRLCMATLRNATSRTIQKNRNILATESTSLKGI